MPPNIPILHVAIGVVERRNRFLICRRHAHRDLGGYWEFPGGKRLPGEPWIRCVRRELREELSIHVKQVRLFRRMWYRDRFRTIYFQIFRCALARGTPRPLDAQELRWVPGSQLHHYQFPPANARLLADLIR